MKEGTIINDVIDKYLITEGWFNKDRYIHIEGWSNEVESLIGFDIDTQEEVHIVPKISKGYVEDIRGYYQKSKKEKRIEVDNYPSDGGYIYGGTVNERYHWAWNEDDEVVYFYYNSQNNAFVDSYGHRIKVYFYPQALLQQNTNSRQQGNGGNSRQQGNGGNSRQQGNTSNDNQEQPSIEDILDPNENHPLSNALLRLVRERYLNDSMRARNLINDLWKIGY